MNALTSLQTQMVVFDGATAAVQFAANWFLQSALLIAIGVATGRLLAARGSAVQSAVYRTTLAAVLICPLASLLLSLAGVSGWSVSMPRPWTYEQVEARIAAAPVAELPAAKSPLASLPANLDADLPRQSVGMAGRRELETPPVDYLASAADMRSADEPAGLDVPSSIADRQPIEESSPPTVATRIFSVHAFGFVALGFSAIWLLISSALLIRLGMAWWQMSRLRRGAVEADAASLRTCRELAAQLAVAPPPVLRSPYLPSPCLAGIRRPVVLLPETELGLSIRDVLVHELAHLVRRDCHWNILRHLALALFFFQPLLWKLSRRLETTAEEVCDDYVVQYGGDAVEYARRLVDIAELSTAPMAAAGVGIVSLRSLLAQRVQRILDTSRSLSTRIGSALLALVLAGGFVGTVVVGLVGTGPRSGVEAAVDSGTEKTTADDEAAKDDTAATEAPGTDDEPIITRGQVLDAAGKPISGATIRLTRWYWDPTVEHKPLAETTSGADGRFEISYRKSQFNVDVGRPEQWKEVAISAFKTGYCPDWVWREKLSQPGQVELKLPQDDLPITGRLIDLEGKPLAGVKIECRELWMPAGPDLSPWLDAVKRGEKPSIAVRNLRSSLVTAGIGLSPNIVTDSDGRFRLAGIGRERMIKLAFIGPTIARTKATVVTRQMDPISQSTEEEDKTRPVFGADFELALPPSRVIEGIVRDAESGEPLPNVGIQSWQFADSGVDGQRYLRTTSDGEGRFRLAGMPKGAGNEIILVPDDKQPYLMRIIKVPDSPGFDPMGVECELHRGIWITGRVTLAEGGKPLPQARVHYFPFLSNEHAQKLPEFESGNVDAGLWLADRYQTAADGSYRIVGLPGRAIVGVDPLGGSFAKGQGASDIHAETDEEGNFETFRNPIEASKKWPTAMKEINPAADAKTVQLDFSIAAGEAIEITAVDPAGQPLSDVTVSGMKTGGDEERADRPTFLVTGLAPTEDRSVLLRHEKRGLGKAIRVRADGRTKLTVRLEPCASIKGRLVDANQIPVNGVEVRFDVLPLENLGSSPNPITTDADGRFRFSGLLPGASYTVLAAGPGGLLTIAEEISSVEPGEAIDLGTTDISAEERTEPVRTKAGAGAGVSDAAATDAAVKADPADDEPITIPGRVLDAAGKPVARATVRLNRWDLDPPSDHQPLVQTTTGDDGRFEITYRRSQAGADTGYPLWWKNVVISAFKTGYGPAWIRHNRKTPDGEPVGLWLTVDDLPITGRLVNLEGQPLAGVQVVCDEILMPEGADLATWIDAVKRDESGWDKFRLLRRSLRSDEAGLPRDIVTDADGRFRLTGIGRERAINLVFLGPAAARTAVTVLTRKTEPFIDNRSATDPGRLEPFIIAYTRTIPVFGPDFEIAVAPTRPIEGIVRDANTGEALPNVGIQSWHFDGAGRQGARDLRTTSDAEGRFRLVGMPKGPNTEIVAIPNDEQPYLMRVAKVPNEPGLETAHVELELHRGIWITGHVTNASSGEPVPQAPLFYAPYLSNEYARKLPEFAGGRVDGTDTYQDRYRTGADGSYRLVGLPGPAIVGIENKDGSFAAGQGAGEIAEMNADGKFATFFNPLKPGKEWPTAMREINPAEGAELVELDFALAPTEKSKKPEDKRVERAQMEDKIAQIKADAKAAPAGDEPIAIRGRVLDAAGKPVAGATVRLVAQGSDPKVGRKPLAETSSGADGRFSVSYRKSQFVPKHGEEWQTVGIIALKQGFGPDCVWRGRNVPQDEPVDLRLAADDVPVTGRLIDLEGRPLDGVSVTCNRLRLPVGDDLSAWIESVKQGETSLQDQQRFRGWFLPERADLAPQQTDADGSFRLTGIGGERAIDLIFEGPTVARTQVTVVTRPMAPLAQTKETVWKVPEKFLLLSKNREKIPVLGADFEFALPPTRVIEGVVRDAKTGEGLAGVDVQSWRFSGAGFAGERDIRVVSDAQGNFRLVGMPNGPGNHIVAIPSDEQPYLMRVVEVPDGPGLEPAKIVCEMHRGIWITGRVTHQLTGDPVPMAQFFYAPHKSNEHARALPEFKTSVIGNVDDVYAFYPDRYRTGADGTYRLVGLPGAAIVGLLDETDSFCVGQGASDIRGDAENSGEISTFLSPRRPSRRWPTAMKEISPDDAAGSVELNFALDPGRRIEVTMVDPDGRPLLGVKPPSNVWPPSVTPTFTVTELGPDEERTIILHHRERGLGKVLRLRGDGQQTKVTALLEPCASVKGRLVDKNQAPVPNSQVRFDIVPSNGRFDFLPITNTDADGRFENSTVLPGANYAVAVNGRPTSVKELSVEPGETIDLGTIDVTSDKRPEPVRTKAAKTAATNKPADSKPAAPATAENPATEFAGIVVDPSGKPVEGAQLYLVVSVPEPTGLLAPKWKPLAATDASGAFRFSVKPADVGKDRAAPDYGFGHLAAVKEGFGFAWSSATKYETSGKLLAAALARASTLASEQRKSQEQKLSGAGEPLKLTVDDQPIRGRIVDVNGQPVKGVRLTLVRVDRGVGDDLAAWHEAAKQPQADYFSATAKTLMGIHGPHVRSLVPPAETDDDGRFTLRGVGRQRIAELLVEGPAIETTKILARTEAGEKVELVRERRQNDSEKYVYYPAELLYVAGPSVPIVGVVRGEKSKAPLAGVTVKSQKRHGENLNGVGADFVRAVTDDHGVYRLDGMPIGADNRIAAIAPAGDTPFFSRSEKVPTNLGKPLVADIDLLSGVWLEGRITDKQTGQGIRGTLRYYVGNDNPSHDLGRSIDVDDRDRMRTDDDGHFRTVVFPGPGYVSFMADEDRKYPRTESIVQPDGSRRPVAGAMMKTGYHYLTPENFHVVAQIDPAAGADIVTLNLQLNGDHKAVGHVVDPQGKPLTGFAYCGKIPRINTWDRPDGDKFELDGYDPASPRPIYFAHAERDLAGSLIAKGKLPDDFVVRLQPAGKVRGRLVERDGAPIAHCEIIRWSPPLDDVEQTVRYRVVPLPPNSAGRSPGRYETDDDGRFEIGCLVPGIDYRLRAHDQPGGPTVLPKLSAPLDVVIRLAPGEAKDLGDVRLADNETFTNAARQAQQKADAEAPPP